MRAVTRSPARRPAAFWPPVVSIVGSFADREAFLALRNQPAHHLYLCVENSLALKNHLAVRDYPRTHLSDAAAYSTLKKALAERFGKERECYVEAKTDFILFILERRGFSEKELDSIKRTNQT